MANRHLSRSIVLQSLFEWDFRNLLVEEVPSIVNRNITEFAPGHPDGVFARELTKLIISKKSILDDVIVKAAPEWPIEKIGIIDRNILRIGLAELIFGDNEHVPPKVAINEAIELAKAFGADMSPKFVNGVLGAVYKEMGQPGKDENGKNGKRKINTKTEPVVVDPDTLPIEKKAGAVIYSIEKDTIYFALVHDIFGFWTLSKGGIDDIKDERVGAAREIKEELDIDVVVEDELGRNEYIASHPVKGKIRKQAVYFLARADFQDLKLQKTGGLDDVKWFPLSSIPNLALYENIIPLLGKATEILVKNTKK